LLTLFNQIVHPIINKITLNLKENQKLTELRDWLLPMLMNGQVKVKEEKETELSMAAEPEEVYNKR
jgi:type I restriction enzyme S subunit